MSIVYMLACNLMLRVCHWHSPLLMAAGRTKEWKVVPVATVTTSQICFHYSVLCVPLTIPPSATSSPLVLSPLSDLQG